MKPLRLLTILSDTAGSSDSSATVTNGDKDMGPYANCGVLQCAAIGVCAVTGTDTDESYAWKLQESATTVDSDYVDITNGGFTAVTAETAGSSSIQFLPAMTISKRYVRSYVAYTGTSPACRMYIGLILTGRFDT